MRRAVFRLLAASIAGLVAPVPGAASAASATPAAGRFLVATRQVTGPYFAESVVLLLQTGNEGAIGLIVNRPTSLALAEVVPDLPLRERADRVYFGGPVGQDSMRLLVRAAEAPPRSERVLDDVWVSGSAATLRELLEAKVPAARLHAFAGYAGWGPGQLEGELARGDWLVVPAAAGEVFARSPGALWEELLRGHEGLQVRAPGAAPAPIRVAAFAADASAEEDGAPGTAAAMTDAAAALFAALTPDQRDDAHYAFDDDERTDISYAPIFLDGVRHDALSEEASSGLSALLAATLSPRGLATVRTIRALEGAVARKEERSGRWGLGWLRISIRDAGRYLLAIFGEPGAETPWGYRYEGHHVSLNLTVVPGHAPASTPLFLGAEPRAVPEGDPMAGVRALGEEETLARALFESLDAAQRGRARLPYEGGRELMLGEVARVSLEDAASAPGLARGEMTPAQQARLDALVERFVGVFGETIARARRAEIERAGRDDLRFAWTDADEPPGAFYARVAGPGLLLEIDNTTDGDHVHAVWHRLGSDFGEDLLARHHREAHGGALRAPPAERP